MFCVTFTGCDFCQLRWKTWTRSKLLIDICRPREQKDRIVAETFSKFSRTFDISQGIKQPNMFSNRSRTQNVLMFFNVVKPSKCVLGFNEISERWQHLLVFVKFPSDFIIFNQASIFLLSFKFALFFLVFSRGARYENLGIPTVKNVFRLVIAQEKKD